MYMKKFDAKNICSQNSGPVNLDYFPACFNRRNACAIIVGWSIDS